MTAQPWSNRYRAKQKLYRRKVRPLKIDNPIAMPSAPNPLLIKAAHRVPRKCKYCDEPCTKGVLWCEGRARVPVCNAHVTTAIKAIGGQSEVDGIQDLVPLQKREDDRDELRKGPIGRLVRGGASIAAAMTPDELSRRSKKGWEHRQRSHLSAGVTGKVTMSAQRSAMRGIKPTKPKLPALPGKDAPAKEIERAVMRRTAARGLNEHQRLAYDRMHSKKQKAGRLMQVIGDLAAESFQNSDIFHAYLEGKGIPAPPKYGSLHDPEKRAAMRRYIREGTMQRTGHRQFKITHDELIIGEKNRMKRDREKAIMQRRKTRIAADRERRQEEQVASMGTGKIVPGKTVPELDAVAHSPADLAALDRRERQRETMEQTTGGGKWTPEKQARLEQLQRERLRRHAEAEAKAAAKPVKRPAKKKVDTPAPDVPAPTKKQKKPPVTT